MSQRVWTCPAAEKRTHTKTPQPKLSLEEDIKTQQYIESNSLQLDCGYMLFIWSIQNPIAI